MKKTLSLITSIILLAVFNQLTAQTWTPAGPDGANIVSLKSTSSYLFAASCNGIIGGTQGGVWRSADDGASWELLPGMTGKNIHRMYSDADTLFVDAINSSNTNNGGLFRSTDNGNTWVHIPSDIVVTSLARINSLLFFGFMPGWSDGGIAISADNGHTITSSFSGGQIGFSNSVVCLESMGDTMFIGTQHGLFRSTDNCATWDTAYSGIYLSDDPQTWDGDGDVEEFCKIGNTLFAGTYQQGVYKSKDLGSNWGAVNGGLTDFHITALYAKDSVLFAGTKFGGIFKSTDEGNSWTPINQGLSNQTVFDFIDRGNKLFTGGQDGVYTSSDSGNNWTESNSGLAGHSIIGAEAYGQTGIIKAGNYLFASTMAGSIYRSSDNGIAWQRVSSFDTQSVYSTMVTAMAGNDSIVFASSTQNNGVHKTVDWGDNWTQFNVTSLPYSAWNMMYVHNIFYAICDGYQQVFYSEDGGLTWAKNNSSPFGSRYMCSKGNDIFVCANSGADAGKIFMSNGGSSSFTYMGTFPATQHLISGICAMGDTLFASAYYSPTNGYYGGIYKSGDNGTTWTYDGLSGIRPGCFAVEGNTLFMRNPLDVYIRYNGTWTKITSNLPFISVGTNNNCSDAIFANDGELFVGVSSRSLYKADISQFNAPAQPNAIIGSSTPCLGTVQTYSVTKVPDVTYTWTLPSNWIMITGQGTDSISVVTIPGAVNGNITVMPSNYLGNGTAQTLVATLTTATPAQPSSISGNTNPFINSTETYSVEAIAGVTYNWTFPSDWTIVSGQNTNSVSVLVGTSNGSIQVLPSNSCGTGTINTLSVTTVDGVEDLSNNSGFCIYPNPTDGKITVSLNGLSGKTLFTVQSVFGSVVYNSDFDIQTSDFVKNFDFSNYSKGIYYIKIINGGKSFVHKFVVK